MYYKQTTFLLSWVNPIDLGFTFAFLSRISVFKFHCHIFLIYYIILPNLAHTITFRFLPNPPRQLQSDVWQTHPDDYNKNLPNPPRQLQLDFCQTHPVDYNQIFATSTWTITVRFLPNPTWTITVRFLPHTTQRITVRFLPHSQR